MFKVMKRGVEVKPFESYVAAYYFLHSHTPKQKIDMGIRYETN